jgi:hypothetical protein
MLEAELKILSLIKYDLSKFKANDHYSLLFSLLFITKASDQVIRKALTFLNESFLCESFQLKDFPNLVAVCMIHAFKSLETSNSELFSSNWLETHYFQVEAIETLSQSLKNFINNSNTLSL